MTSGEKYIRGSDLSPTLGTVAQVYTTAMEVMGRHIPPAERGPLWAQVPVEQVLALIASILAEIDLGTAAKRRDVDRRWVEQLVDSDLKGRLLVASRLGSIIFVPQVLLISVREALQHCPSGPPANDLTGLDVVVKCMLGIADETSSTATKDKWGGLPGGLSAEMIANHHFNRSLDIGHQLTWVDRAWFQSWPDNGKAVNTVGGQPQELFEEATGVRLDDFAAVALNLYVQASRYVRFPPIFFDRLGLPEKAIEHFLSTTALSVDELRTRMSEEWSDSHGSLYAFDTVRRFPIVRLNTGELLVLRVNFVVERALSEVTYFDVQEYLAVQDNLNGTKRRVAFRSCTNKVLEHEVGVTLKRIFSDGKTRLLSEDQLQRRFGTKSETPSVCDFAIRKSGTWLLIEVTDRTSPRHIVFGKAASFELDAELDNVLIGRKARQLSSTIDLVQRDMNQGEHHPDPVFIPLVLTAPGGIGWNTAVHRRVVDRLRQDDEFSASFASSVAFITLRDLRILESLSSAGQDVIKLLREWRQHAPGDALDHYLLSRGFRLAAPKWEKKRAELVMSRFIRRMRSASEPRAS